MDVELRAPAYIVINSTPDSAIILLDRKKVGNTPFKSSPLRPGDYNFMLMRSGYNKLDTTITVTSGLLDTLNINLVAKETAPVAPVAVIDTTVTLDTAVASADNRLVATTDNEKKKKKIAVIIGGAIFALLTTLIVVKEFSGE